MINAEKRAEFGDFQTPRALAVQIAQFLKDMGLAPSVIVEPTSGYGSFVHAAIKIFPKVRQVFAFDINANYVEKLRGELSDRDDGKSKAIVQDFFSMDWKSFFNGIIGDLLIIGNPPWVTNSALGSLHSTNLPEKNNFQNHNGFAAKTGKANFDISEWMLIKLIESLQSRPACIAMLCKTAVARKVLRYAWLNKLAVGNASLHVIDAKLHFDVSVDACLFVVHTGVYADAAVAVVYDDLSFSRENNKIGLIGKELIADVDEYAELKDLEGFSYYIWRSGVKHDAARVMELKKEGDIYRNGLREAVEIEDAYVYPLLKSSDLANGALTPTRFVLLTQRRPGDDTSVIAAAAPATWRYLVRHAAVLDGRRSIIYQKRPRFAVFGIGPYSFAPWKVAVSALYKNVVFQIIGPYQGKTCVVDDTCYFIPCASGMEAEFAARLLNSDICMRFLKSMIFFDAKRPVTIDILNRIDLMRLAERLGMAHQAREFLPAAQQYEEKQHMLVFEKKTGF